MWGGDGGEMAGGGGMSSDESGIDRLLVNFNMGGVRNCFSSSVTPVVGRQEVYQSDSKQISRLTAKKRELVSCTLNIFHKKTKEQKLARLGPRYHFRIRLPL